MNYSGLKKTDIANGPGVRVSLFVSGCRNHCSGCFNPETWDFNYGDPYTEKTEEEIIRALSPPWIQGFSLLGGEPMEPENESILRQLLSRIRVELPDTDIWLYTGYRVEQVIGSTLLKLVDVVVDGPFEEEEKDISLSFRGSRNQRILRLPDGEELTEVMSSIRRNI